MVWKDRKHLKAAVYATADKADKQHFPLEGSGRLGKPAVRLRMLLPKHSSYLERSQVASNGNKMPHYE